jgi:hypothetical protein
MAESLTLTVLIDLKDYIIALQETEELTECVVSIATGQ